MIDSIKKDLEVRLAGHDGTTALYLSGGSDSTFLLNVLLDMKAHFSVVAFDYSFSREQKRVIDDLVYEYGIRVFSYKPFSAFLVGDGEDKIALVEEYPLLDGTVIPFVRDVKHDGKRCAYDVEFDANLQPQAPIGFTLNLFGTRKTDRHWTFGKPWKEKEQKQAFMTFFAPLWDLTREDVKAGLKHYGVKYPKIDTGCLDLCTSCLTAKEQVMCPKRKEMIDPIAWLPTESLGAFKAKYAHI